LTGPHRVRAADIGAARWPRPDDLRLPWQSAQPIGPAGQDLPGPGFPRDSRALTVSIRLLSV